MLNPLQECFKHCRSVSNIAGVFQTLQECFKHCRSVSNIAGVFQILQECFKHCRSVSNIAGVFQTLQECFKHCRSVSYIQQPINTHIHMTNIAVYYGNLFFFSQPIDDTAHCKFYLFSKYSVFLIVRLALASLATACIIERA